MIIVLSLKCPERGVSQGGWGGGLRLNVEANRRGLHVKLKVKTEEEREERRRLDAEATRAARETRAETEELR